MKLMSTRSTTLVIDREFSSHNELGFALDPRKIIDNSYVNMYIHHDGYPSYHGVELASWILEKQEGSGFSFVDGSRMAAHLVHDFHYSSQYLYPTKPVSLDCAYTYVIWTGKKDVWISIYDNFAERCVFVGMPHNLLSEYKDKHALRTFDHTDWPVKLNPNKTTR